MISALVFFSIQGPCWQISLPDSAIPARMRVEGPRKRGDVSVYTALTEFGVFSLEIWVSQRPIKSKIFRRFSSKPQLKASDTLLGWRVEEYLAQGDLWQLEVPYTSIVLATRQTPCDKIYLAFLIPGQRVLFDERRLIRAILGGYNLIGK